jgi:hypothetical protein
MRTYINAAILLGLLFPFVCAAAPAGRIVVAKSGGDFTSIQAAIDSVDPGAAPHLAGYLIEVMPGVYEENIRLKKWLYVRGYGAVISGALDSSKPTVTIDGVSGVTLQGFRIDQARDDPAQPSVGISIKASGDITIEDCEIVGPSIGIDIPGTGAKFLRIENNRITNVLNGIVEGSTLYTSIFRNILRQARSIGISSQGRETRIEGNHVDSEQGTPPNSSVGIVALSNAQLRYNTVLRYGTGISLQHAEAYALHNFLSGNKTDMSFATSGGVAISNIAQKPITMANGIGWMNHTLAGSPNPAFISYEVVATTPTAVTKTTSRHPFCGLTFVKFQAKDPGTNRWCELAPNADSTWNLTVRNGQNSEARCRALCY